VESVVIISSGVIFGENTHRVRLWLTMPSQSSIRERIEKRIARRREDIVFLSRDFQDLGSNAQVLQTLRRLVRDGQLVRLGYGVYGRAVLSRLSGEPMLYSRGGFIGAVRQALDKLGVEWEPTKSERDYNEGRSTQIPVNPVIRVKGRFRRQLRYGNARLILERPTGNFAEESI
jgi:Family of unknown function (DUF6088)